MHRLALTTCPDLFSAKDLAERLVTEKLAACVNIIPQVISVYEWQGKLEQSAEVQLIIKTVERNLVKIESILNEHHPYDVPEFIVLKIESGATDYLDWINQNTRES